MLPSAVHSVNATSPTRRGSTQCAPRAYRGGTGVPKGRLAVQRDKLPLQAGQHRPGEPGADVPGIAQPAVVGNAQDQRSDRAGAATLAGLPAADVGRLVPDVLDLDPVPPLARMVEGGQRLADRTPFRPCLRLAARTASASSRYPRRRADRVGVKAEVLQPGPALGVGQAQQRVLAVIQQVEQYRCTAVPSTSRAAGRRTCIRAGATSSSPFTSTLRPASTRSKPPWRPRSPDQQRSHRLDTRRIPSRQRVSARQPADSQPPRTGPPRC